jgi:hypothetical protein
MRGRLNLPIALWINDSLNNSSGLLFLPYMRARARSFSLSLSQRGRDLTFYSSIHAPTHTHMHACA